MTSSTAAGGGANIGQLVIKTFQRYDTGSDGLVPRDVIKTVLQALNASLWNEQTMEKLLQAYGKELGDGRILYTDFACWIAGASSSWNVVVSSPASKMKDAYAMTATIGEGAFGSVRKATHIGTAAVRAVKTIEKLDGEAAALQKRRLDTEIEVMKDMDHPCIIRLYEVFEDRKFVHLAMELCTGGTLLDRLAEAALQFTERQAASVMRQVVGGIGYMHENCVCHRDIKLENFLLAQKDVPIDEGVIKIADFGLSIRYERPAAIETRVGTAFYMAPEIASGGYSELCDCWSCGVLMYILLCGMPPFRGEEDEIHASARAGDYALPASSGASSEARDLVGRMLTVNPRERCTAAQASDHEWIRLQAPAAQDVPLEAGHVENLQAFYKHCQLKKAALHVIAHRLSASEIDKLKDMFKHMDANLDGYISFQELQAGIEKMNVESKECPEKLMDVITTIDVDRDRRIDYTEFLAAALGKRHYHEERVCWDAFQVFDLDGSGFIERPELLKVLLDSDVETIMGSVAISRVMDHADADGDGLIDFEEFMKMMRAQ